MTPEELAAIETRAQPIPEPPRNPEWSHDNYLAHLDHLDAVRLAGLRPSILRLIAEVRRLWDALDDALDDAYAVRGELVVTFTQDEPYDSIWCNVHDNVQSWDIHGTKVTEFRDWLRGLDEWTRSTDVEIRAWLAENIEDDA